MCYVEKLVFWLLYRFHIVLSCMPISHILYITHQFCVAEQFCDIALSAHMLKQLSALFYKYNDTKAACDGRAPCIVCYNEYCQSC